MFETKLRKASNRLVVLINTSVPHCPEAVTGHTRWYLKDGGQVHIGFPPPARPRSRVPLREVDTSGTSIGSPRLRYRPVYNG